MRGLARGLMMSAQDKLDLIILTDAESCQPGDRRVLDYSDHGYADAEVENRLKALGSGGYVTIAIGVGLTLLTGITPSGRVYLRVLRAQ